VHNIQPDVPPENIVALIRLFFEHPEILACDRMLHDAMETQRYEIYGLIHGMKLDRTDGRHIETASSFDPFRPALNEDLAVLFFYSIMGYDPAKEPSAKELPGRRFVTSPTTTSRGKHCGASGRSVTCRCTRAPRAWARHSRTGRSGR
jgi:hypothetical protein